MNSEWTDAGGGAGGGGGGAEGKGGDEAIALSTEYLEVAAMVAEPAFDVNTSRCSDGEAPILFAVGAPRDAPAHEDCLVLVLGLPYGSKKGQSFVRPGSRTQWRRGGGVTVQRVPIDREEAEDAP
jgi:hypothetical protein